MLHLTVVFLAAFLLFQVQPLVAKLILPLFGGGAAIWTACLFFFQAFLLLGYMYSHFVTKLNSMSKQAAVHAILLVASLYFLPVTLVEVDILSGVDSAMKEILLLLFMSVGIPFFMLASTGPIIQRWLTYLDIDKTPYKLYSLSNFGSLLALLSYPFLVEPSLTTEDQTYFWSIAYIGFVAVFLLFCLFMLRQKNLSLTSDRNAKSNSFRVKKELILWLLLSAVGVILLVSTTNAMTQNIPPVPFLWILPLCIYLLTYIISFHSPKWYVRWYWFILFAIASFAAILLFFIGTQFDIITQVIFYSFILLSACMICHGELARLKPEVERLTLFYLCISIGGFLGSAFVVFVAQNIFSQFYEYPLAVFMVFVLFIFSIMLGYNRVNHITEQGNNGKIINMDFLAFSKIGSLVSSSAVMMILLPIIFFYLNGLFNNNNIVSVRNFYGVLSVKDVVVNGETERRLIDGTTSHGTQSLEPGQKQIPRSYYRDKTGISIAFRHLNENASIDAGFIGLGAGVLAAYGRKGDNFIFYELNPNVERIAYSHFTYLEDSRAKIDVILGDGRRSLAYELATSGSRKFQLLVIDAFTGDIIPMHLLTKEAFDLYWQHLVDDGILAIHISNRHLNLEPLVYGLAKSFDKAVIIMETVAEYNGQHSAEWVLLSNSANSLNSRFDLIANKKSNTVIKTVFWTDNYSNLLSVLKW